MTPTHTQNLHEQEGSPQMTSTKAVELLTVEQAAERLGMSVRHVRRLLAERRVAYHRLGRAVRLHPTDLDAYVAATRVAPLIEEPR
jgi:excisionase family DNA binding protein